MAEKNLLEHLEVIGEFIDAMDHAEFVDDDSTAYTVDAIESFKVLEKFFKGYYESKALEYIELADKSGG